MISQPPALPVFRPLSAMASLGRRLLSVLLLVLLASPVFAGSDKRLQSPEDFLRFKPGSDKNLADWTQIYTYLHNLSEQSDWLKFIRLGYSTEGRPMAAVALSTPGLLQRMELVRDGLEQLANPDAISEQMAGKLVRSMPALVVINCSLHSTEITASQFALQFAYDVASGADSGVRESLRNVIAILIPSANPDGIDLVADWYRKSLGTPHEGLPPVELYHKYAGHDNNRDWFMLNLDETRLVTRYLYREWYPQVVYDLHEMGGNGPRTILPPYNQVVNPLIDISIRDDIKLFSDYISKHLGAAGIKGVASTSTFDMWWHGGFRTAPYYHNAIGILAETASARLATPDTLHGGLMLASRSWFPDQGTDGQATVAESGIWRMQDIMRVERAGVRAVLKAAAENKHQILQHFYRRGREALMRGKSESPNAYVIPVKQHDTASARKLLDVLIGQGIRVYRAMAPLYVMGTSHPAGTFVIPTAQPYRANLLALLEPQSYPQRQLYPGGPPEHPYDVSGWTLSEQLGVDVQKLKLSDFFQGELLLGTPEWPTATQLPPAADYIAIAPGSNDQYRLLRRLQKAEMPIFLNLETIEYPGGAGINAGHFLVADHSGSRQVIAEAVQDLNVTLRPVMGNAGFEALLLEVPRVGVYKSWIPNKDEGWTRYVLDDFGIEHKAVHDSIVLDGDLARNFDTIILPDISASALLHGHRYAPRHTQTYPKAFTGGLGMDGIAELKRFVASGGTLMAFGQTSSALVGLMHLEPAREVSEKDGFFAPGTLLRTKINTRHRFAFGMPEQATLFVHRNAAWRFTAGESIAQFPESDLLVSGWLRGGQQVQGLDAVVALPYGAGQLVLYGCRPQHRGQTHGTYKLFINPLIQSRAAQVRLGEPAFTEE